MPASQMLHSSLRSGTGPMAAVQVQIIMQLFIWRQAVCEVRYPPEIVYPSHNEEIYYRDNDRAQINCSVSGNHNRTTFKWTKNGTIIQATSDINYDPHIGVLNIVTFSRNLVATYRCIVTYIFVNGQQPQSEATSLSPTIHLKRCWLEQFSSTGYNVLPPEHYEYFSLPCGDHGTSTGPGLTYRWVNARNNNTVYGGRFFVNLKGTLFINWIHSNDRGMTVVCMILTQLRGVNYVELGRPFNLTFNLIVIGPRSGAPIERYISPTVVAKILSDAILECMISVYDGLSSSFQATYWEQSGSQIHSSAKYQFQYSGRRLTIRNVTVQDEKRYNCWAHNSYGRKNGFVFLNVISPPVFIHGPPPDKTVLQGEHATFNCDARSVTGENSTEKPIWYINSVRMGPSYYPSKFHLNANETLLTIRNAQKISDIMCVQCEVRNEVDTAFANACLNILLPMVIVTRPPMTQRIEHGDIVNLTVVAISDPYAKLHYRWEFGNESFDLNSTPSYFVVNPSTMEAYINTSWLAADKLEEIAGHYNIVVYHDIESHTMGTDVVVIPQTTPASTHTTEFLGNYSSATEKPVMKQTDTTLHVVVLIFLLLAILLFLICCLQLCAKKRGRMNGEEQGGGHLKPQGSLTPEARRSRNEDAISGYNYLSRHVSETGSAVDPERRNT